MIENRQPEFSPRSSVSQRVHDARRHWERARQPGAVQRDLSPRPFTIALAREIGTEGTAVACEVGKLLGWQAYDHELLEQIAQDMGLRTSLLKSVDERHQSWLLETAENFMPAPAKGEWIPPLTEAGYVHQLVQTVLALGHHGECVIVGRGAAFVLPARTTLRVRLVGTLRDRVAVVGSKLGISEAEAARRIRTIDRERTDFIQDHFFKDPTDPENYDLILNAPRLSVSLCARVIVETLHGLESRVREPGQTAAPVS